MANNIGNTFNWHKSQLLYLIRCYHLWTKLSSNSQKSYRTFDRSPSKFVQRTGTTFC